MDDFLVPEGDRQIMSLAAEDELYYLGHPRLLTLFRLDEDWDG